jgi:hypothetical protein
MKAQEIMALGCVVVVLVGAMVFSLRGTMRHPEQARAANTPVLVSAYPAPATPHHQQVRDAVVDCLVHYGKIDPGMTDATQFDPTPLSHLPADQQQVAVASLRARLEPMCVVFSAETSAHKRARGDASALPADRFWALAQDLGMDVAGARDFAQRRQRT